MALTDKDIIITPNRGQAAEPKIEFRGASSTLGPQTISLNVYPTDNGTISFEGSAGQLFSITNTLSGTIYSVNDVSGIPSIEVLDTGLVKLAQYGGNVLIGTGTDDGTKLQVSGGISTPTMWVNNSTSNNNNYNENIRLFPASNNVSTIAFGATGTTGIPWNSILGYSDRFEIRQGSAWQLRSYSGYIDISGYAQATRFISTVATGTAPLTVTSTTAVTNLNADLLDGQHGSYYAVASSIGNGTLGVSIGTAGATNTTVTWGTASGFSANTSTNYTYDLKVGPALTALASTMTGATTGFIKKSGADTYSLDTNTYLTGNQTITLTGDTTGSGATSISTTTNYVSSSDDRIKAPADDLTSKLRFGFTSWNNNNTSPYADYLHLRSYTDSSGGSDNLVMFRKDAIGIRVWQQTYGSATAYATYKDVAFTDQLPTVNNGSLTLGIGTAGATNTTVTIGTGTGFSANTASNLTYDIKVGPALTNLATLMTTAGAGFIRRGATADTYTIDTNTYLTAEADTLATVTARGNTATSASIAYFGVNNTTNTNGYGISLYGGAVAGQPTYGLMFQGTATFGTQGGVTGDWATYFTMNNSSGRGWIFRDVSTPSNVASITNTGLATFNDSVRSPIFYDSNDTNFYLDPAGTSRLNYVKTINSIADDGYRFTHPGGGSSVSNASTVTGAIKIKLPVDRNNSSTMVQFKVRIYEYNTGKTYEFIISGYNYSAGSWYNIAATQLTDANRGAFTIRYGYDTTSDCVWIGETTTVWDYPQVYVTDVLTGHSGYSNNWGAGWAVSFVTAFDTVEQSRTASLVKTANNANNWAFADYATVFYDYSNTAYYADPASNSVFNTLTLGGYAQNNPVENYWQSTNSYIYDATNGMRYYWIRIGRLPGDGYCQVEIESKTDSNYAPFVQGIASFSSWTSTSVSVQFDLTTPESISSYVALDNNSDFWIRCDSAWSSHIRWRFIYNNGCTIWESANWQKTETTVPVTHIILRPGQTVRTTRGNVTATSPSSSGTNTVGSLLVRGTGTANGDFRAPIFYDSANTAYYIDAASTSNLLGLTVTNTITGSISGNAATVTNGVYTSGDQTITGAKTFNSPSNTFVNTVATSNQGLSVFQDTVNADAYMTFHIGGDYAAYFGLGGAENDLVYGGWSAGNNRYRILHSGNYNSYAPTLTGTGASGTWGISITGNAATATSASNIDGVAFNNSNSGNPVSAPNTLDSNGIGYVTNISLFGQTDGALYSQAYSSSWQHQIYGDYRTGQIAIRGENNGTWQAWRTVLDSSNYNSYAPTLTGTGASGTWGINITGYSRYITYNDGPRDLSDRLPNSFTRSVLWDFVGASAANGSGNYGGVMTFIPWTGTTASTGDSSYQLAFGNTTGVNASGQPKLSIRNGIDTTWNSWFTILHSGNWSSFITNGSTITDDTTTNATRYLLFDDVTSGAATSIGVSSTKLYFNPSTGQLNATDFNSLSDATKKENVKTIENATQKMVALRGVTFDWIENKKPSMGVIAQEVEEVVPEVVSTSSTGEKSVNYGALVGLLIQTVKEQNSRIEQLEKLINTLITKD